MLFFYAHYASDQNGKWHMLFRNPTSDHPSFISRVCSPSFLTPCDKQKKKLYYSQKKGNPQDRHIFGQTRHKSELQPNKMIFHTWAQKCEQNRTHVVLFMNPTTMVGPSLPLSLLYTQWVVLTQSFFNILQYGAQMINSKNRETCLKIDN